MPVPELAIDTVSIVIKGTFDPSVLTPKDLVTQGLIEVAQVSEATQKFSTSDISILETQRIRFLANREVIQLNAQQADEFEPLRDLAVGVLRIFTSEKVSVLGINREVHFAADTAEAWHAVGNALAPKKIWSDEIDYPGMASLTIQGARRDDVYEGYQQITVQPSNLVAQGVFISHNDHYTLEVLEKPLTDKQFDSVVRRVISPVQEKVPTAIAVLNNEWTSSMTRAATIIDRIAVEARS